MYFVLVSVFLVALHTSPNFVGATPMPDDEEVVYNPSDVVEYTMPESCVEEGKSYCFEKGDSYPDDKVEELLKDIGQLKVVGAAQPSTIIGNREGSGNTYDEPDCPATTSSEPVYYIIDDNGKVRVVVQSPNFKQIYSMKWCQNEGRITKDTSHFLGSTTLEKFHIECVNTKMNVDFFVLNDNTSELKMEIVTVKGGIPVCCRCRVKTDGM